jgi:hypothetical protein
LRSSSGAILVMVCSVSVVTMGSGSVSGVVSSVGGGRGAGAVAAVLGDETRPVVRERRPVPAHGASSALVDDVHSLVDGVHHT